MWRTLCRRQRRTKHARFALTDALASHITSDGNFRGWRKEFERAARDSDRDAFLTAELSSLTFVYQRKRGDVIDNESASRFPSSLPTASRGRASTAIRSGERWAWRQLSYSNRAIVVGPAESPFPAIYASRELDWTWRLENRNVLLTEVGRRPLTSAPPTGPR